jgi:hypothetical protein
MARRTPAPSRRAVEGGKRRLVLSRCLADRGAHDQLEDLILAKACCSRRGDIVVGDFDGLSGDLFDEPTQRLWEPCICEGGSTLLARRLAVSFEDPRYDCFVRFFDIGHSALAFQGQRSPEHYCSQLRWCPLLLRLVERGDGRRPRGQQLRHGPGDATSRLRQEAAMRTLSVVTPLALIVACAEPTYVYRPTAETRLQDAPGQLDGHDAAVYQVPQTRPRGKVQVVSLGLATVKPSAPDERPVRALRVRMVVHNGDEEVWFVAPRAQTALIPAAMDEEPLLATCDGQSIPMAVLKPADTRVLDLYYTVPDTRSRDPVASFRVHWRVETPKGLLAENTTEFEYVPPPPPAPRPPRPPRVLRKKPTADGVPAHSLIKDDMQQPDRGGAMFPSWRE